MTFISAKSAVLISAILFLGIATVNAQVKIGSAGSPNSNAVLELDGGTNKGLLLPRLSNTQLTALTAAPDGLIVYNTTDGFLYLRKAAAWQKITDATNTGGGGLTLPYTGSVQSTGTAFFIYQSGTGDAILGSSVGGDGVTGASGTGRGGYFSSDAGAALVTSRGPVGINTVFPAFPLDIDGRARIRSNGPTNSAGIWYDKIYTTGQSSFVGTFNDSSFGIYGAGNWKFFFDHVNNKFGVDNSTPQAPLSFSNAPGNKMDIYYGSSNSRYGIGLQAALMQLYSATAADDIAFGYGSSSAFTERMRIKGNGNVGIGIAPTEKFEINTSLAQIGWKHSWAGGSLVSVAPSLLTPAAIRSNSAAVQLTTNTNVGLYIKTDGTIGAGINTPTRQLDVNGRMRIRGTANNLNNSAGIYFDGPSDNERAFVGIETNDKIGIYGEGSGWGMSMNVTTGNTNMYYGLAVGTTAAPNSKLQVAGSVSMPFIEITDNYTVTDNDYAVRFVTQFNTDFSRTITLPPASGRAGRIYKISAKIPVAGPANASSFTPTRVYLVESGTNINVIQDNLNGIDVYEAFALENYQTLGGVNFNTHGVIKRLSLTVQSNGTSWKVIEDSFQAFADYKPEE